MKSGLEGRNNHVQNLQKRFEKMRLNEVRPRRPEQCQAALCYSQREDVSMKSGLEGRNNRQATQVLLPLPKMSQ